ncbi:hypothetical protein ACQY0O_006650 [Thecaphora frezii]
MTTHTQPTTSAQSSVQPSTQPSVQPSVQPNVQPAPRSSDSHDASTYLEGRLAYPQTFLDAVYAYHNHYPTPSDASNPPNERQQPQPPPPRANQRWQRALDIGCGPGQLALHLATRFHTVYAQDPSHSMLHLASNLKRMSPQELARHSLPAVQDPHRIHLQQASGQEPVLPPGVQLDVITLGCCINWLDWSSPQRIWRRWSSLLCPGGSLFILGLRPIVGPLTGQRGSQLAPLRDYLLRLWFQPRIRDYFDQDMMQRMFSSDGFYARETMPWDLDDDELKRLWNRDDYVFLPLDEADGQLRCADPSWIPGNVMRTLRSDNSQGDLAIVSTTPRQQAQWARSTSGYVKLLAQDPQQRERAKTDEDIVAVEIRRICKEIGIGYDEEIQRHQAGVVIGLRRSQVPFSEI